MMGSVTLVYLVQHGGEGTGAWRSRLTGMGREQAAHTGRRLRGLEVSALYSSPMRRARESEV